jgi:ABC-type bacteriocin/lantibiotic exporter with double-glycine peptidase domain
MLNNLTVPFFRQETDSGCLPACAQMVLAHLGLTRSQANLACILDAHPIVGTPHSHIARLRSLGVEVNHCTSDLDDIARWLEENLPVIAFVQLRELPYWEGHWAQHALVVVGLDKASVHVLDPARDEQAISISRADFMLAWDEMDGTYAVITPGV